MSKMTGHLPGLGAGGAGGAGGGRGGAAGAGNGLLIHSLSVLKLYYKELASRCHEIYL